MNLVLPETILESHQFECVEGYGGDSAPILHGEIFHRFDQIGDMRAEWDAFVEKCEGDIYSSFDWCRIWWKHYGEGRQLDIHVFRSGGQIVGLVPAFRERLRLGPVSVQLIRLLGCDHSTTTCGVVIAAEQIDSVIAAYCEWLLQDPSWNMVQWSPLAGYFPHRERIAAALGRYPLMWSVQDSEGDGPHVIWRLPPSFEEFLGGLSKKERSNIKIGRKRLAEGRLVGNSAGTSEELSRWFPIFIEQHQKQWRAEGKLGHFADWPGAESFHRELAATMSAQNRLWLLRLDVADHPVGFQYNYRFGRRIHWLLGSRDVDLKWDALGSGRTLHAETIEKAIADGYTEIDGLRGMYEYKLRLGGKALGLQSITLIRQGGGSALKVRLARLLARMLDLLYYRIWFSRIAPKLPLPRRGLWKVWIRSRI